MRKIFTNGSSRDYVKYAVESLTESCQSLRLAAPYFTENAFIKKAADAGKPVQLLVELNAITSPKALRELMAFPNVAIRFYTGKFHAKIFLFDDDIILGSANITGGGFISNREAAILLNEADHLEEVNDIRALFMELWDHADVLTDSILSVYQAGYNRIFFKQKELNQEIRDNVGITEPNTVLHGSEKRSREKLFIQKLRRQVHEQFRPAFNEVAHILENLGLRRSEFSTAGIGYETSRFLSWVRRVHAPGEETWKQAELLDTQSRAAKIENLGLEWKNMGESEYQEQFIDWNEQVLEVFGTEESIREASKEQIANGLIATHAFYEQLRFTKGGADALPATFWERNQEDLEFVRSSLLHYLFGDGDFIERLHDIVYDSQYKIGLFGFYCALELYGTIKPSECPPMNGRTAKALRFLGFNVNY